MGTFCMLEHPTGPEGSSSINKALIAFQESLTDDLKMFAQTKLWVMSGRTALFFKFVDSLMQDPEKFQNMMIDFIGITWDAFRGQFPISVANLSAEDIFNGFMQVNIPSHLQVSIQANHNFYQRLLSVHRPDDTASN